MEPVQYKDVRGESEAMRRDAWPHGLVVCSGRPERVREQSFPEVTSLWTASLSSFSSRIITGSALRWARWTHGPKCCFGGGGGRGSSHSGSGVHEHPGFFLGPILGVCRALPGPAQPQPGPALASKALQPRVGKRIEHPDLRKVSMVSLGERRRILSPKENQLDFTECGDETRNLKLIIFTIRNHTSVPQVRSFAWSGDPHRRPSPELLVFPAPKTLSPSNTSPVPSSDPPFCFLAPRP